MEEKINATVLNKINEVVNETVRDVEKRGGGLTGIQKLSMAIDFTVKILKSTGIENNFPDLIKKIIRLLPKIINFTVDMLNELGVFQHSELGHA